MRIVIADPSRTAAKAVARLLERDGHVVTAFADGYHALEFIKATPDIDALITSAELAGMSGLELCWETRLLAGRDRAIHIILMSSNAEEKHLINALDGGADDFIGKPPSSEELYARLRSAGRLLGLQRELIRLATIDALTGVFNRRAFFEKAERLCRPDTAADALAAIMFDVDHFKRVNDSFGHAVGDQVLRAIGRQALRQHSMVGRLGGEEFAILLQNAGVRTGMEHAERLRVELGALSFDTSQGRMSVTCSFGVAQRQAGETVDQLLKRADTALYKAKDGGRNRVVAERSDGEVTERQWSRLLRSNWRNQPDQHSAPALSPTQTDLLTTCSTDMEETISPSLENNSCQPFASTAFILDDEPQIGALVSKVMQACGLTPRQFTSPAPFLEELKVSPPGLVVLDLSLGQSDAVEIIHSLEVMKYQGKVLLISGRDETTLNEITHIGERHGLIMLPPLKKPFRPADVRQRLVNHVAAATQPAARAARASGGTHKQPAGGGKAPFGHSRIEADFESE